MIFKKLFQKSLMHPWIYHLFNAVSVILSVVAWHSIGLYCDFINDFGAELPQFTHFVMQNYQNMLAFGVVAIGLSIFAFWKKQKGQNTDGIKKISFYLMSATVFCYMMCLIAVYLVLAFIH